MPEFTHRFVPAYSGEDGSNFAILESPMQIVSARLRIPIEPLVIAQRVRRLDDFDAEGFFDLTLACFIPVRDR